MTDFWTYEYLLLIFVSWLLIFAGTLGHHRLVGRLKRPRRAPRGMQTCQPASQNAAGGRCDWIAVSYSAASYLRVFYYMSYNSYNYYFFNCCFFLIDIISFLIATSIIISDCHKEVV